MTPTDPARLLAGLERAFTRRFGCAPAVIVRAPGRVNLLGEHLDYNEGPVLPAAIDRAVYIAAAPSHNETVTLHAIDFEDEASFRLDRLDEKTALDGKPLPGWAEYPAGAAWALKEAGLPAAGMLAAYASNIPIGAGLSSSAAVEVGFALVWSALAGWQIDRLRLAQLAQRGENGYVGVNSGLMDEFASACGIAGHALYFDTRSLEWQPAPIPPDVALVIADSGVRRSLASTAYNERRAACEAALHALQEFKPGLRSLRDIAPTEFAAYSAYLAEIPRRRAEHVVKEIARVESALRALQRSDLRAMGALLYAGHASLRDLYEVSTPEIDALVELARPLPGCYGARLTGAGFGGCTINLVALEHAPDFITALSGDYAQKTGREAQVYLCVASQGAEIL